MNYLICLIMCLFLQVNCINDELDEKLKNYLNRQTAYVNKRLRKEFKDTDIHNDLKLHVIKNVTYTEYSTIHLYNLFNVSYALLDGNLFYILQNNSLTLEEYPNTIQIQDRIIFVKSEIYNELGLLLLGFENHLKIYGLFESDLEYFLLQEIDQSHLADAKFFKNQNNFYLITANNRDDCNSFITLYKFVGLHFDEIRKVTTTHTNKISTFTYLMDEMILAAQYSGKKHSIASVYKFDSNRLEKVHKFRSTKPKQILTYVSDDRNYIIIFDFNGNNIIYLWDGTVLQYWNEFQMESEKAFLIYLNKRPMIITSQLDKLLVFTPIKNSLKLIIGLNYTSTFTNIFDVKTIENNILVSGLIKNSVHIKLITISGHLNESESPTEETDVLQQCLINLEQKIYNDREKLNNLNMKKQNVLMANQQTNFMRNINVRTPIVSKSELISQKFTATHSEDDLIYIGNALGQIDSKFNNMKLVSNRFINNANLLVLNGTIILQSSLNTENLTAKNIIIKNLNNRKWTPEEYLSKSHNQTIKGRFQIKNLISNNLSSPISLFNDLLLNKSNQRLTGSLKIVNLFTKTIYGNNINNISFDDIYFKSNPTIVKGMKQIENLNVKKGQIHSVNNKNPNDFLTFFVDPKSFKYNFDKDLVVENLWIEEINNVNWDKFKNSVFRVGITNTITGSISVQKLIAGKIETRKLSGIDIDNILTTTTDQIINSNMKFIHVYTDNIDAGQINGMKLENAITYDDRYWNGTIKLDDFEVEKNLTLSGSPNKLNLIMRKEHIVGTNESDLLQIYKKKVTIKGNLFINNLQFKNRTRFIVSDEIFTNNFDDFWRKNIRQVIPVHLKTTNILKATHLNTNVLNGIEINNYMVHDNKIKKDTIFYMNSVTILGNLHLNDTQFHSPDLKKIDENSVKISGTFRVYGEKIYRNALKVDNLEVNELNNMNLTNKTSGSIEGTKYFQNLIIKGDVTANTVDTNLINDIDLEQLQETALYINEDLVLDRVIMEQISIDNLHVTTLNDHDVNEYILHLNKKLNDKLFENVYVDENIIVENVNDLKTINNREIYNLTKTNKLKIKNGVITGDMRFSGNVVTKNLNVVIINNVNMSLLAPRLLYRKWKQNIKVTHKFRNIKTNNLITPKINGFAVDNLVDISSEKPQKIFATNGLRVYSSHLNKSLISDYLNRELEEIFYKRRYPPTQTWETMDIVGNVTFLDQENLLYKIIENAVTNENNRISTPVYFTNDVVVNNLTTKNINNVAIDELYEDALMMEEPNQVVTGKIIFDKLQISKSNVYGNINAKTVNTMNITDLNDKLIRTNHSNKMIRGQKTFFAGLQTINFITKLNTSELVTTDNPRKIPNAIFASLEIEGNFNLKYINNVDFNEFLSERLLRNSREKQIMNGTYYFDRLHVINMQTIKINDIRIDDIVFDRGEQIIESPKTFYSDIIIDGDVFCDYINGYNILKIYKKSLIRGKPNTIKGNVMILSPSSVDYIMTDNLNGYPFGSLVDILNKESIKTDEISVYKKIDLIEEIIRNNIDLIQQLSSEYLYIERSYDLQIAIPNTIGADATVSHGHILLHIKGEESGDYCGLPVDCNCPIQHTVEITPHHSINHFVNKGSQRIFTYNNDQLTIHFISNSVSHDKYCRHNGTKLDNEVSSLTWNTNTNANRSANFYFYPNYFKGFISNVEFFTINGGIYLIIGRYYDPIFDSYDLDCIVMKFNNELTSLEEIQRIPTVGTESLHLFHTAQGVIVIIGNANNTEIFRFDSSQRKFVLLRTVPVICSRAIGVVLSVDSLIVLAQKSGPLLILKYHPQFDNYYFYQSFQLEYNVVGVSVFYSAGFGISDAYLCITTKNNHYFIYSFKFIEGWKLESYGELEGLSNLTPFELNDKLYIFASSTNTSMILDVLKYGSY